MATLPPPPSPRRRKPESAKFLSRDQVRALLEAPRKAGVARDYYLLCATYFLGLRLGEVVALRPEHFTLENDEVFVPTEKRKSSKSWDSDPILGRPLIPVHVFSGKKILQSMVEWAKKRRSPWIFHGSKMDRHLGTRAARVVFHRWADDVGLPKQVSPHALRHTAGSLLYEHTQDALLVRDFLRHSSLETTNVYLHSQSWRKATGALSL